MAPTKSPSGKFPVFLAANRLPVSAVQENGNWSLRQSPGGLVSALNGVEMEMDWTGWTGQAVARDEEFEVHAALLSEEGRFNLRPVFLTEREESLFYDGFSNQVLWPNFHELPENVHFTEAYWKSYLEVNRKFANSLYLKIREHAWKSPDQGCAIWVHDYQLMLVPQMLRDKLEQDRALASMEFRIGFFLHIPFPAFGTFSQIPAPVRRELLLGLLGADLIGFHDASYLENFKGNIRADLGIETAGEWIQNHRHRSRVGVFPIGIEPGRFAETLQSEEAKREAEKLERRFRGKKVILGVDRLDPSKGLLEKLKGFETFLETQPEWGRTAVLVQIAVPSRTKIREYALLKDEVFALAERINLRFARDPKKPCVEILHRNFSQAALSAYYRRADIMLITSIRDGMNLVAFEYTACRGAANGKDPGVLVLSGHSGAASYLDGALHVDPISKQSISRAITRALEMASSEKSARLRSNLSFVRRHTSSDWARHFIEELGRMAGGT